MRHPKIIIIAAILFFAFTQIASASALSSDNRILQIVFAPSTVTTKGYQKVLSTAKAQPNDKRIEAYNELTDFIEKERENMLIYDKNLYNYLSVCLHHIELTIQ